MKHRIYIIAASILALVAIIIGSWLPWQVTVSNDGRYISISNGYVKGADLALEPSSEEFTEKDGYYEYEIDGDKVIVGDDKTETIDSTVRFERWGKEAFLGIELEQTNPTLSTTDSKVISLSDENKELKIYPVDGGIEYEIILSQAPATSTIVGMFIESENLQFFYQPALDEELDIGVDGVASVNATHALDNEGNVILERSADVVGSYAVYHVSKYNNEYKTGKAFHIYRPKLIDAKGNWIWGTLTIDTDLGIMYIQADSAWLEKAVYPVVVDPTFGYTSLGASTASWAADQKRGSEAACGFNGTLDSVFLGVNLYDGSQFKAAVYKQSDGSLVDTTAEENYSGGSQYGVWTELAVNTGSAVTNGTTYVLLGWAGASTAFKYDSTGGTGYYQSSSYGSWPDPIGFSSSGSYLYSIYAEGTESGSTPDISNAPDTLALGVLEPSSTYWSNGSEPSWPLTDGDAYFTVSNTGSISVNISISATNPTGGVGHSLTSGSPGENQIRISAYDEGSANTSDCIFVSTSNQTFITSLASSANIDWEMRFETGTFTDGAQKTSTVTLTAVSAS